MAQNGNKPTHLRRAIKDVCIDAVCVSLLFFGYEAFFDHYKLIDGWTHCDVGLLVNTAISTAKSYIPKSEPKSETPQIVQAPAQPPAASTPPPGQEPDVLSDAPLSQHAREVLKLPTYIPPAPTSTSTPGSFTEPPAIASVPVTAPHIPSSTDSVPPADSLPKPVVHLRKHKPQAIKFEKKKVNGIPLYLATIDLQDPQAYMEIALPHDSKQANTRGWTDGDESFEAILKRHPCAFAINGTFFAKDSYKCVMGNMVSGGNILKYSQWENYGTTLGVRSGMQPEMVTARWTGQPNWYEHWFSLTCGPRLITDGEIKLDAESEGFADSHVLGCGPREAIGYNESKDKLYVVSFLRGLSLAEEAKLMKAIGCYNAMNLDGGASKAVAYNGKVVVKPGRNLTNVLLFYDCKHPAPKELIASFKTWEDNHPDSLQMAEK